MTTKSHQPEFVSDIVDKTLDRIVSTWGFERKRVIPLEASMKQRFELGGMQFNVYDSVQFSVNGKGWSTDFKTIARDTAYDEKE